MYKFAGSGPIIRACTYCSARNETKRSLGGRMCHSAPVRCRGQRASVLRERRSHSMALTPWWCAPCTDVSVLVGPPSQESGEWWWRPANANARTKQKKRLPYCVVCSFESHTVTGWLLGNVVALVKHGLQKKDHRLSKKAVGKFPTICRLIRTEVAKRTMWGAFWFVAWGGSN